MDSTENLLDGIHGAADLRGLSVEQLERLCAEIRTYLIDTVSKTAGHLASGLAVVELTCALHYVFDTPEDKVIWDVGHQAYPHKIITGHKQELTTLRQKSGLHAFVWRGETPYDVISTGHASTSVGSALGLALAYQRRNLNRQVVCVIGDGAITGGAAFEALNHAGSMADLNLLVILNDNEMSITRNVGSVAQHLASVITSPHYVKLIEGGRKVLSKLPAIQQLAARAQEHVKGMVMPGTLFEELGFNYVGPVDGHDLKGLINLLGNLKKMGGLQFLHVVTTKGKGYAPAEADPIKYHGVPPFDPHTGIDSSVTPADKSFSAVFGRWLCDRAELDERTVGITPAMKVGSAMLEFSKRFPERFYDVGIAEQHAMVFASGLAAGGLRPVVNIYSSFLQRAYDGVIHDMAIQDLPVVLAVDRAGIVGPDGPTHQGAFDIAFLRTVPNLVIMAPADREMMYRMLNTAYNLHHPAVVRFPRCQGQGSFEGLGSEQVVAVGKGRVLHEGHDIAVAAFGPLALDLLPMCQRHGYTLLDMCFVKPFDRELIAQSAATHRLILTVEEGAVAGGIGEEIAAYVAGSPYRSCLVLNAGLPDRFIMEDTREGILHSLDLDAEGIERLLQQHSLLFSHT